MFHFLARPRRFGKSLLCSIIGELFLGNSKLFDGTYIKEEAKWDFEKEKRSVIHLDMSNLLTKEANAEKMLQRLPYRLCEIGNDHGVIIPSSLLLEDQLAYLIKQLHKREKKPVVVIIDEYDSPILDLIRTPSEQIIMCDFLSTFYGQLKSMDEHLRLVYITGILKFSSVSLFSKLNNLIDHTFTPAFATVCGYTEEEILLNFKAHLERYRQEFNCDSTEAAMDILRSNYNGYCFGVSEKQSSNLSPLVYNPFAINYALTNANAADKWIQSGHSRFLIERIIDCKATGVALSSREVSLSELQMNCTPVNLPYDSLMYYAGYSTIKSYDHKRNLVTLAPPNDSINDDILSGITDALKKGQVANAFIDLANQLVQTMFDGESQQDRFKGLLNEVITTVPWQMLKNNHTLESTYNVLFSSYFKAGCSGVFKYCGNEISTSYGDVELVIENVQSKVTVIVEFKLKKSPQAAIDGIKERSYHKAFPNRKKLILVGINITEKHEAEVKIVEE